jgi:hypothetical protein
LIGLIVFGTLIWIIVQASAEKSQRKWKRRFVPVAPVARHVRADALAVVRMVRAHLTFRRERKRVNWDITEVL